MAQWRPMLSDREAAMPESAAMRTTSSIGRTRASAELNESGPASAECIVGPNTTARTEAEPSAPTMLSSATPQDRLPFCR
jgi:hypothetical protein